MKTIKISQFGQALSSRSEGREAALSTISYHLNGQAPTDLVLDFQDVIVMTPSWLGEYLQTLISKGVKRLNYVNTSNPSVASSLEFVRDEVP